MRNADIDEDLSKRVSTFIAKYHKGEQNPVQSKVLEDSFQIRSYSLRRIINALRCEGHPICSTKSGYFYADSKHDVEITIAQLNNRISKMAKARDGLVKSLEVLENGHTS